MVRAGLPVMASRRPALAVCAAVLMVLSLSTTAARAQPAPSPDNPPSATPDNDAAPDAGPADTIILPDSADVPADPDAIPGDSPAETNATDATTTTQTGPTPTSAMDSITTREPPVLWQEWMVRGDLLSSRERDTLHAFFASEMRSRQSLSQESREELAAFASSIGYHLSRITTESSPSGTMVVIHVEPVTLVRRVKVDVDNKPWLFYMPDTVFEDEIVRRMRLRPGTPLSRKPEERSAQLRMETQRIADYLSQEGFFDARVDVKTAPDGERGVKLEVNIKKGQRYELGKIKVTGNESVPTDEIAAQFRHGQLCVALIGRCAYHRFSRQELNKDVQKVIELYHKRGYPAVRVTTDFGLGTSINRITKTVEFTVIVNERRKIDVVFEGNDPAQFSDETLKSLLTFNEEGSYDDVEVTTSAEAIRRHYQSRGYFEANVTFQRERFGFFERLVFTIHAGARLAVREVSFEGNQVASLGELQGVVTTRPRRTSPLFASTGFVTSAQIAEDIAQITELYRKKGFSGVAVRARVSRSKKDRDNAAVLAALVASMASSEGLYITFHIDEGPRSTVESVAFEFEGEHVHTAERLAPVVDIKVGEPYHKELIEKGLDRLERFYFRHARPHAKITAESRPGSAEGLVQIVYRVFENHQVRFGKVLVQGNFKTEDWVILDELGYVEGAPLSLSRAEAGQQNLRASGLFSAVQVAFLNLEESAEQDINVLVRVEERYDYRLGFEAAGGYSSDAGFFGELGLINPNFLGKGLRLDLRGQYGTQFSSLEGKLIAPRWILRRLTRALPSWLQLSSRFEAAAFWRRETTQRFGDLRSYGTSLAISKLFRRGFFDGWLLSLRYDLRQRNREEPLLRGAGPSDDLEEAPVDTRTGAIGPQLVIDKRRDRDGRINPLTPESGFKLDLKALYADRLLLGQDRFIKLGVSGQHFWKPSERILITNAVRYDHGIPIGSVVLPEVERYFAGGDTTVRGYEEDRLATEVIEEPLPPYGDVTQIRILPAGGNIRFIHNLDLQIEVWKLLDIPVASAIFLDTGLITNSLDDFKVVDLRHALGVALMRWVVPFGSLSIEWAIPLDPKLGDDPRGRFHFNFGLLF